MGFITNVTDHISVEERRESFKIHADHEWQPRTAAGNSEDHIELPYDDLPYLLVELLRICDESCSVRDIAAAGLTEVIRQAARDRNRR